MLLSLVVAVTPFTTTGFVVVFLIFCLFQRGSIRNRFLRLAGSEDLERTTAALDAVGRRLGRFFLTQLILNATFGAVIGLGLAAIGCPAAPACDPKYHPSDKAQHGPPYSAGMS